MEYKYIKPTYTIKSVETKELLLKFDFHKYNKDSLIHRFPVYKYKGRTLVYGEFVIYDEDKNILHVTATDTNGLSCNYNEEEYGRSLVTCIINSNILNELNKFIEEGLILVD